MSTVLTFMLFCAIIMVMNRVIDNQVPSYQRHRSYRFDTTKESLDIYKELNAIAEEIEQCRLRNV